jgi:hypothetical protein
MAKSVKVLSRLIAAFAVVACSDTPRQQASRSDSSLPILADTSTYVGKDCPVTGHCTRCHVLKRLGQAGLALFTDSAKVTHETPLTIAGTKMPIARGQMWFFVYADSGSRSRDQAKLDTTLFIAPNRAPTIVHQRTLVANDNLLVFLDLGSEVNGERIANAPMAGPPQPVGSHPIKAPVRAR